MGVFVKLDVMFDNISPEKWSDIYDRTVEILKKFPEEVMSIKKETTKYGERVVFCREFEKDIDDEKERRWRVIGDMKTKERAEDFILYRNIEKYKKEKNNKFEDNINIVTEYANYDVFDGRDCRSYSVFDSKTQGCQYHNAMLAVAIYIENCLYPYAMAYGDLTEDNVAEVMQWLGGIVNEEIKKPVRFDMEELFKKLNEKYKTKDAIYALDRIFMGGRSYFYQYIDNKFDKEIVKEHIYEQIKGYNSPTQFGVIDIINDWLSGTGKIKELLEIFCIDEKGPKFNPVECAKGLASAWINVEDEIKELYSMPKSKGAPVSIGNVFSNIFMDMGGLKGRKTGYYIKDDDLFKIFEEMFPDFAAEMKVLMLERKKKEEEKYKSLMTKIDENLKQEAEKNNEEEEKKEEKIVGIEEAMIYFNKKEDASETFLNFFRSYAKVLKPFRTEAIKVYPEDFTSNPEDYIKNIIKYTNYVKVYFTEDAWGWIDVEKNICILEILLMLSLVKNDSKSFWDFRKAIFENRNLCAVLSEMVNEEVIESK